MAHADFVHLPVHSAYSLSEGALKIADLVELCRADAMPAVAVTDSANMFGALEFAIAAAEAGVQPIIGCQLDVAREPGAGRGLAHRQEPRGTSCAGIRVTADPVGLEGPCTGFVGEEGTRIIT